jgi:hypothetical protein
MSKMLQCLSVIAVVGVLVVGSQPTRAGNIGARGGKSDFPVSEPGCWGVNASTVQNNCPDQKFWYVPLPNVGAGWFWVSVTAQAANNSSNVQCISTGANRDGTIASSSGWFPLPQFGPARDINLNTFVPSGGSGEIDCAVLPGGKVHTVSW